MNLFNKIITIISGTLLFSLISLIGSTGNVSAACLYQYSSNGFNTSSTPVFNSICGVPEGIGNENNFVRIRPDVSGNDENNQNNPNYTIGTLTSVCNGGSKYDIWNYVHNNASQNDNPDVGSGSAVALNTAINMTAPIGTVSNLFNFGATVSASNATSVTDSAVLNCGNKQVKLSLVPGSIHIYSEPYGGWQNLPNNSLNNSTPLGSTNAGLASMGSGNVWGCWNYRIVIVYQVEVNTYQPAVLMPTCNLISLENDNGVARIDSISYTANSATVTGYIVDIVNGSNVVADNLTTNQLPFSYNMTSGNTYTFKVYVVSSLGNVTSPGCTGTLTAQVISRPPTPTPPTPTPPKQLVNTGPGSFIGLFVGVTILGAIIHNFIMRKKVTKNN